MNVARRFCGTSVGRKYIVASTGVGLVLFLVVHLLGNSTIFFGARAFNSYAAHLHGLGSLLRVAELGLLVIFVVHISFATSLFIRNRLARPQRYAVVQACGGRTPGSRTMFYTGLIVLALLIYHVASIHFADHGGALSTHIRSEFSRLPVSLFYLAGLVALGLHLSHGLWSLCQSLGLNHPLYDLLMKRSALGGAVVIAGVFMAIPLLALFWKNFLR